MDPLDLALSTIGPGLPRARGDGPLGNGDTGDGAESPPRPRGWTRPDQYDHIWEGVSPAPAGMDPARAASFIRLGRLPRARGDGPYIAGDTDIAQKSPPRPRGWTLSMKPPEPLSEVSPAPAGMDPTKCSPCHTRARLPRARGDGPSWSGRYIPIIPSPPRPRGWTHLPGERMMRIPVSPAPAGMDPGVQAHPVLVDGLPRARGDGPSGIAFLSQEVSSPPRPRGWTRPAVDREERLQVSPAPAGMDPSRLWRFRSRQGLPRARGDGPSRPSAQRRPASSPPRPRGWTLKTDMRAAALRVSPAPAGMDPRQGPWRYPLSGLPRARGDGPVGHWRAWRNTTSPPRPRGWTLHPRGAGEQGPVSPAPAGMDRPARKSG